MHRIAKQFMVLLVVFSLTAIPFAGAVHADVKESAKEVSAGSMMADAVFLRPVGLVACAVGLCAFVVAVPFAAMGDNVDDAKRELVEKPFRFTFQRPLGEF